MECLRDAVIYFLVLIGTKAREAKGGIRLQQGIGSFPTASNSITKVWLQGEREEGNVHIFKASWEKQLLLSGRTKF